MTAKMSLSPHDLEFFGWGAANGAFPLLFVWIKSNRLATFYYRPGQIIGLFRLFSACAIIDRFFPCLPVIFDHFFCLVDSFGHFNVPGAGLGAFKMILAGPGPIRVIQFRQPVFKALVPGIGDKAKPLNQGGGSEEIFIPIINRTGRKTGCTQDAIGGIVNRSTGRSRGPHLLPHGGEIWG